jgi:hypothetical protein
MKLSQCKMGEVVITNGGRVGHIVGFAYNIHFPYVGDLSAEELKAETIPVVKFPLEEYAIHYSNLKLLS